VARPSSQDWLAVGFRSPEQTFRTFQTGLRAGLPDLEYRCFGTGFKRRAAGELGAFSLLGYAEYRSQLFRKQPLLKLAATAEIKEVRTLAPGRARVVAEVDTWFHDETFAVELVREDFYELYVGELRVADDLAEWGELTRGEDGMLMVRVPLPGGMTAHELDELRAGREWKIDGFPLDPGAGELFP
jgi:hypothetical protein